MGVGPGTRGATGTTRPPPVPEHPLPLHPPPPPRRHSPQASITSRTGAGAVVDVGLPTATCWVKEVVRPRLCFVASSTCWDAALPALPGARTPLSGPPGWPSERTRRTSARTVAIAATSAIRRREGLGAMASTNLGRVLRV